MKTIKQAARLSQTSVRTLQYYDNIGLLTPSGRTATGYRLYNDADIAKLKQILLLKTLGFSLKEIRTFLERPDFDQTLAFQKQKELLCAQSQQTGQAIQILDRLEHGASLADCAEDIKSISKESKKMKRSSQIILATVCAFIIVAGATATYFAIWRNPKPAETETPPTIAADVININPATWDGVFKSYALDVEEIDETALPMNSPVLEQIAFPADLREPVRLKALYTYKHTENNGELINYVIRSSNGSRYVAISFASDRTPIREMYAPEGESSIINGHEVMIGYYEGQAYLEESQTNEPIEKYYIDFATNGINYNIETHGLSETEVVALLKTLL